MWLVSILCPFTSRIFQSSQAIQTMRIKESEAVLGRSSLAGGVETLAPTLEVLGVPGLALVLPVGGAAVGAAHRSPLGETYGGGRAAFFCSKCLCFCNQRCSLMRGFLPTSSWRNTGSEYSCCISVFSLTCPPFRVPLSYALEMYLPP